MTIIQEIADALDVLGKIVKNTRSIIQAVNDGKEYLARRYPDANEDFAELLKQMQITVEGLAEATGIMTGFRFVVGSEQAAEKDLVRFNDYLIKQKQNITGLRGEIRKLKADCKKIQDLRDALNERHKKPSWSSMFGLVGMRSSKRREELAQTIGNFYGDDQRMIAVIQQMLRLTQKALSDVDRSLGEAGIARAYNVPRAAQMLGVYSSMFDQPQQQLNDLVESLDDAVHKLRSN